MWWVGDVTLSPAARKAIADPRNDVWVSVATAWEIAIKRASGRLDWPQDIAQQMHRNRFSSLAVNLDHAVTAGALPPIHGDPFDRVIVAQAQIEGLAIVTRDREIARYDVPVLAA